MKETENLPSRTSQSEEEKCIFLCALLGNGESDNAEGTGTGHGQSFSEESQGRFYSIRGPCQGKDSRGAGQDG